MMVTKHNIHNGESHSPDGQYVSLADYEQLESELAELRKDRERLCFLESQLKRPDVAIAICKDDSKTTLGIFDDVDFTFHELGSWFYQTNGVDMREAIDNAMKEVK